MLRNLLLAEFCQLNCCVLATNIFVSRLNGLKSEYVRLHVTQSHISVTNLITYNTPPWQCSDWLPNRH